MRNILLIPSWYPSIKNNIVGSFFREQAHLLDQTEKYDIKVLFGVIKEVTLFEFISFVFFNILKKKIPIHQNYLLQAPSAYSFEIKVYSKLTEKHKYSLLFRSYRYAYRTLSRQNKWIPDLIHAQSALDAGIFAKNLSVFEIKKPYVVIEHQVFLLHYSSPFKQNLILSCIQNAEKVGVVSEHQKKMVLMHQPNCKPITIWNYVNENKFYIDKKKEHKKFTIITITYPSSIKGYKTFFETMALLKKTNIDFQYIIIGNSSFDDLSKSNSSYFEQIAKQMDVFELGVFLPYLERNELNAYFNKSDVFVSCSIAETYGIAAREAMMCGLPIITTSCGGIEDSITPQTGRVVPIYDALAMSNVLLQIKNKDVFFQSETIRDYIVGQCGTQAFINKMNNFYD